jgi:hypothetical protein
MFVGIGEGVSKWSGRLFSFVVMNYLFMDNMYIYDVILL